ncbi:MAG: T9SS type A sorting domain-containing protein [Ignavibacterium sp.]|nr:T9SS type A sorting domain-containing protein [Ignavibacterium sp.]
MTPHLGQLFELRVVKVENQEEAGRVSLPAVLVPNFTVYVPGFDLNKDYNIDFYADLNGNGSYNAPPADHAWRMMFNSSTGDVTSDFSHNANFVDIQWPGATSVSNESNILLDFNLQQNYPNPFNPSTIISYSIPQSSLVTLKVYDIIGNEVAALVNKTQPAGKYDVRFNGSNLSNGVYLYRIETDNFISTKKMILMK